MTKYEDRLTKVRDSELEYMYERDRNNYSLEKEMRHRGLSTEEEEDVEDYYDEEEDDDSAEFVYGIIKLAFWLAIIGGILYGLTLGLSSLHYIIYYSANYQGLILFALVTTFILVSIARGCSRFFNWLFYFSLMGTVTLLYRQLIISEEGSYTEFMNRFDLGDVLGYSGAYLVILLLTFVFGSILTRIWGYLVALYFPKSF